MRRANFGFGALGPDGGTNARAAMIIVFTVMLTAVLLAGAGFACARLVERRADIDLHGAACALLTGWALLSLAGVVCAVSGTPLTLPAAAVGAVGVLGYVMAGRAGAVALAYLAVAWLLLLPLLAIAAVIPPTMADEFPYLLPNAKTLVAADIFPDRARPNVWTSKPEYPPAFPLIAYAAARLGGIDVAQAGKVFTVLLAGAFGLALAQLIVARVGALAAIAIGVALASVLNPFFDPRLALSAHSDTPTGFVLALGVAAAWRALDAPRPSWVLHAAAAAIVLVLLRETNLVFVAGLAIGLLLCRRPKLAIMIVAPALLAFALWWLYVTTAGWRPTMSAKPPAAWDWTAPFVMLRALFGDRLANNPVLGLAGAALALAGVLLCVRVIRSGDKRLRDLFVLTATVAAVWCGFLAWAYAAVFRNEVESANSAWRYLTQLGPLLIYAIVAALAQALPARAALAGTRTMLAVAAGAALVVLAIPFVASAHWRIDCRYPDVAVVRRAALAMRALLAGGDKIAVVHPEYAPLYIEVVDYELGLPLRSARGYKRAQDVPPGGYRLDVSQLDRDRLAREGKIPPTELARWEDGAWRPVQTLPAPQPRACGAKPFAMWQLP